MTTRPASAPTSSWPGPSRCRLPKGPGRERRRARRSRDHRPFRGAAGRSGIGVAAESLAAKWFDKNPALSDEQNLAQLRQSLDVAIDLYETHGTDSAFGLFARTYREQLAR